MLSLFCIVYHLLLLMHCVHKIVLYSFLLQLLCYCIYFLILFLLDRLDKPLFIYLILNIYIFLNIYFSVRRKEKR